MNVWLELSGESPALASAELDALLELLGGHRLPAPPTSSADGRVWAALPDEAAARALVDRAGLLRRGAGCWEVQGVDALSGALGALARTAPGSISIAWAGGDPPGPEAIRGRLVAAFRSAGGRLDLRRPDRRLYLDGRRPDDLRLSEELPRGPAADYASRRMPRLPFQRPVSLPPKLARAAVNLAGVRAGARIADPFVGTGALLLEAGLIGAKLHGVDRDAVMVRGALRNLAAFGLAAERLVVADAGAAIEEGPWPTFDAIVTDPPYGRASSSGGEATAGLLARVLPRWAERVRPEGRIVLVVPGGEDPLPWPWRRTVCVPHRVHRSLTREFRVYRRSRAAQ